VWAAREVEERGWRVWVARVGVGRPRKGGSWAGPESNNADFDLKRISKLNTIIFDQKRISKLNFSRFKMKFELKFR
jgi:hypothetical protein